MLRARVLRHSGADRRRTEAAVDTLEPLSSRHHLRRVMIVLSSVTSTPSRSGECMGRQTSMSVSGPELATHAFGAGLVDECHLFLAPIVIGGGKRALPEGVRVGLELLDERRFGNGMVYLHYRTKG